MSQVFDTGPWLPNPPYMTYSKLSAIRVPTQTWVFIEEHPNSINDGAFAVTMADTQPDSALVIVDFPASFHNGACGISYSDGRAEIHKWRGSTIQPSVVNVPGRRFPGTVAAGNSAPDIRWLSSVTSVKQ